MPERLKICVLGAGVIGLHAANRLQQDFPAAQITVIAAGQGQDTTSIGAAGLFRPGFFNAASPKQTDEIIDESWRYYRTLFKSEEASAAGICEVPGYILTRGDASRVSQPQLKRLLSDYRTANERELNICPGGWKNGTFFTTLLTDDTYHLGWLTKRFKNSGGEIVTREVKSLDEIEGFDIIVNCTGLGAKALTGDRKLVAIRGQVIKVKAPWIKTFFYAEDDTYVIPGVDYVTLGGTRQFGSVRTAVDEHDAAGIWERCLALVPSLKRAEIVQQWVGLRPHRDPVRLEKELLASGVTVVHSYGHGGYGVMTAPGSAVQVSRLVAEVCRGDFSNPTISNL